MRRTILIIFVFSSFIGFSQNLVLNPGFEEHIKLPYSIHDFKYIKYWKEIKGSASYFHKDGGNNPPNGVFGIPVNSYGFQKAHSGNAYASIMAINHNNTYTVIQGVLKEKLIKNHIYYAEIYLSLADNFNLSTSNLWFAFSDSLFPSKVKREYYENLEKQIINNSDNFFIHRDDWEKFSGKFIAKGNEKYIAFGSISKNMYLKGINDENHRVVFYIDDIFLTDITGKLFFEKGKPLILKNIFFNTGKYNLLPASYPELNKLINYLKENPDKKIKISGHTDNVGSDNFNKKLSENRAKAVVNYLISKGIKKERLKYAGYGSSKPVDTNKTPQGRQNNRRVEVIIIK